MVCAIGNIPYIVDGVSIINDNVVFHIFDKKCDDEWIVTLYIKKHKIYQGYKYRQQAYQEGSAIDQDLLEGNSLAIEYLDIIHGLLDFLSDMWSLVLMKYFL